MKQTGVELFFVLYLNLKILQLLTIFVLWGLCTTYYKILAKILVNRLRPHLQNLISPAQGAFIKGRDTFDIFLLASETLHVTS